MSLLDTLDDSVFFFASPTATLSARGVAIDVSACVMAAPNSQGAQGRVDRDQVQAAFAQARASGVANPILVGAAPFDSSRVARLSIAENASVQGPLVRPFVRPLVTQSAPARTRASTLPPVSAMTPASTTTAASTPTPIAPHRHPSTPVPSVAGYEQAVNEAIGRFAEGGLHKVVLARTLEVSLDAPPDYAGILSRLLDKNARGYTYAVPLATPGHVFIGATPELLVRRVGNRVHLNPLAGSAPRSSDPEQDRRIARDLLASSKDLHEHKIVIDAIAEQLAPLCSRLDVPSTPTLTSTDALWHLSTTIEGELLDPDTTSLDLAYALHPTPAVCGYPTRQAFETIRALEPFERELFAGFVGWMDASGDGEWAVSLRCAWCTPSGLTLFAGAGIVPDSVAASESAETQTKFKTMLSALGVDATPAVPSDAAPACDKTQENS